jgi:hypothetical protein
MTTDIHNKRLLVGDTVYVALNNKLVIRKITAINRNIVQLDDGSSISSPESRIAKG